MADNQNVTTTVPLGMKPEDMLTAAGEAQANKDAIIGSMGQAQASGSGAQAPIGEDTKYSWEKQGSQMANTQYQADVQQAKQNALANRQTIEQNSQAYQQQADMMKYSANQSAQSAGWTGGYVLDQNRQMEYLKSSIQAQMYGAMELQKYGYDTSLAAARLSYDLNQQEFAHQYYMDAVNVAVTEAEQTGYYISAEARDMLSQFNIAQEKLNKDSTDTQAQAIVDSVKEWFKQNSSYSGEDGEGPDISDVAIKTLSTINMELSSAQNDLQMYMNAYFETLDRVQAADAAAAEKLENDPNYFIQYDENGKEQYDPNTGQIILGNFNNMSKEEVIKYVKTDDKNKQNFIKYIDSNFEEDIQNYLKTVASKDGEGNYTYAIVIKELQDIIQNSEKASDYKELLNGYEYVTEAGESVVTIKVDESGNVTADITESSSTAAGQDKQQDEVDIEALKTQYNLSDTQVQTISSMLNTQGNKGFDISELCVNNAGDTFSNNSGDRGSGNNFSVLYNGEILRVQNGEMVKARSELDIVLDSYSTSCGALAIVDNILYVRDNTNWYVVEARDNSKTDDWQKLVKAYNLNYTTTPPLTHHHYYDTSLLW